MGECGFCRYYFDHDSSYAMDEERIIRLDDPYVFRVSDEYHQLFIGHYYDGYDDTSGESEDTAESDDPSSEWGLFSFFSFEAP